MTEALSENELAMYFALRRAGDLVQRAVAQQLRSYELTEVQFTVLAQLSQAPGGIGMSELAASVVISKGGLTYQAKQLEARGLVSRVSDERDERAARLALTDDGRELLTRALPEHIELVRALLIDRIGVADLDVVRSALERIAPRPPHLGLSSTMASNASRGRQPRAL